MDRRRRTSHDSAEDVQFTEQQASTSQLPSPAARSDQFFRDCKYASEEDSLVFNPRNFSEEERSQELQTFFDTSAPSKVKRSDGIGRISALSYSYESEALGDLEALKTSWDELKQSEKTINLAAIAELARRHGCMGGNWFFFQVTGDPVDRAWEKIARATVAGELGTHAKVTPCQDRKEGERLHKQDHCISVYTEDFTDKEAVLRLEETLRSLGITEMMKFKPRIYSSLGIYRGNAWKVKPSLYCSSWDEDSGDWSISS